MEPSYGLEWLVEAQGCIPSTLADVSVLKRLFTLLIADLQLHPVGQAQWHQFPETGGITGICLLSESHLACHTFPEHGSMCVNVFCCRPREEWPFQNRLVEMFGAQDVSVRTLVRPYATLPSISARRTSADNAAATDGQL